MAVDSQEKDLWSQKDDEYRELVATHHRLEDRLSELSAKQYLSDPEQLEEVTLKKRKLQLKDRMADIMRRHQHGNGAANAAASMPDSRG